MTDNVVDITDDVQRESRRQRQTHHWTMLIAATVIMILATVLHVRSDERVELGMFPNYVLPETCLTKIWFHSECPGCGMTRSFIHLAHGEWSRSLHSHRVGWLLAAAVLGQIPYRWASLRNPTSDPPSRWTRWFAWLLIVAILGNWLFNVLQ